MESWLFEDWLFAIFMCLINVWMPLLLIFLGHYYMKKPLEEMPVILLYGSPVSMKSDEMYDCAHKYSGRLMVRWGWALLPSSIMVVLGAMGTGDALLLCFLCMPLWLLYIFAGIWITIATNRVLKRNFDHEGNWKAPTEK